MGVLPLMGKRGSGGERIFPVPSSKRENIYIGSLGAQLDLVVDSVISCHITIVGNFSDQNCNACEKVDVGRDSVKPLLT